MKSDLWRREDFELRLVGFDDGELGKLESLLGLRSSGNIQLLEPIYGVEKDRLLGECTYFVLPSHSEGFPVAVLDTMKEGLIPILSDGCNLPEAFDAKVALRVEPETESIRGTLNRLATISGEESLALSRAGSRFLSEHFGMEAVAKRQADLYRSVLSS